jgi:FMN-dependent NADH-azoreductase
MDCARDHTIAFESAKRPGEHLLADTANRAFDVVEAPRSLDERQHDHHRPFVANEAQDAAEPATFHMDRLGSGQFHMTRSFKNASLARSVWSHSWWRSHFQTGADHMNILHIDASASDASTSHTRRLSSELVGRLKAANPGATIVYRDLVANQLPHVDMTIRQAWAPEHNDASELAETLNRSKALVDELKAADVVVIGSPMYNFTVPSTLKAWIDHVAIAGQTFSYTAEGPRGLLSSKAYLVLSSGGIYSQGPFAANDHLSTYLKAIFGFLGIAKIEIVCAEGIAYGPEQDQAAMAAAAEKIEAIAAAA